MATNLVATCTLTNSDTAEKLSVANLAITTTNDHVDAGQWTVGTTEESHTISTDVGNAGVTMFVNRDATNFIEIGTATTVYPLRLKAGEACLLRLNPTTATIFAKADTAAVRLQYLIYED